MAGFGENNIMGRIPILKVGDVVQCHSRRPSWDLYIPQSSKGVVIGVNSKLQEDRRRYDHYLRSRYEYVDYGVYWFNLGMILWCNVEDLIRCKGVRHKRLCNECEHRDLCPHLQEIVRCDISEFGQLETGGKIYSTVCEQRRCKHLGVCLGNRWIEKLS